MSQVMSFREWFWRTVAENVAPFLPPAALRRGAVMLTQRPNMQIEATPPPLDANVASIELHYTESGLPEATISLTTSPVLFDVTVVGPLTYFAVAVGTNGIKSAPSEVATFDVADLTPPAVPGPVTLKQVS